MKKHPKSAKTLCRTLPRVLKGLAERKGSCSAVIAAAGDSARFGSPKPFVEIGGKYLFEYSLCAFLESPYVAEVILVIRETDKEAFLSVLRDRYANRKKKIRLCTGGKTRDESTNRAFSVLDPDTRFVAFHDAARPLITSKSINAVIESAFLHGAASAGEAVYDSVKRADAFGRITEDVDRENLYTVSTPQVFLKDVYEVARALGKEKNLHLTDDNAYVSHAGFSVQIVPVSDNRKLTVPEDLTLIQTALGSRKDTP